MKTTRSSEYSPGNQPFSALTIRAAKTSSLNLDLSTSRGRRLYGTALLFDSNHAELRERSPGYPDSTVQVLTSLRSLGPYRTWALFSRCAETAEGMLNERS